MMTDDEARRTMEQEDAPAGGSPRRIPPAGPHDRETLIDREKTPGTGALAEKGGPEADVGPD